MDAFTYEYLLSQPVFYQVLNAASDGVKSTFELVVFIDTDTYILKDVNYKTFLKENYAIALDSHYLFTKKIMKVELIMMF